jgi:outer membrane protein OmpA-like peptidoglycan-associated protein
MRVTRLIGLSAALLSILLLRSPSTGADCDREGARSHFQQALALEFDGLRLITKEQLYKKAIALCATYVEAHNNLGDVYERQGRFEEAEGQYKRAVALRPEAPEPNFGLGDIYAKTNRPQEALAWYQQGLARDPNNQLTRQRVRLLEDMQRGGGVIKAETIRGMLSTTRGPGEVVSITFGEGLIPFDYNLATIRPDAAIQLDEIGKALVGLSSRDLAIVTASVDAPGPSARIEIAGHTDIRGTDAYNLSLSEQRARAVIEYLAKHFTIPKETLVARGYGERRPLCTTEATPQDNACHALNRRVELVKRPTDVVSERGTTRSAVRGVIGAVEPPIILETGFFQQRAGSGLVESLNEGSTLRTRSDRYFAFFRPAQDCFVYLMQEDARGNIHLLFPETGRDASVKAGQDYWIPRFGKSYTLDEMRGEETLFLIATSQSLGAEIEGLSLKEQVRGAVRGLQTRAIKVVPPTHAVEALPQTELQATPHKIYNLIERVEGESGWVRMVRFKHE